ESSSADLDGDAVAEEAVGLLDPLAEGGVLRRRDARVAALIGGAGDNDAALLGDGERDPPEGALGDAALGEAHHAGPRGQGDAALLDEAAAGAQLEVVLAARRRRQGADEAADRGGVEAQLRAVYRRELRVLRPVAEAHGRLAR